VTAYPHETVLSASYPSKRRARLVAAALVPEVGEIDDDRSTAAVDRDGDAVCVRVAAADPVALRAGVNGWSRLLAVAEAVCDADRSVTHD